MVVVGGCCCWCWTAGRILYRCVSTKSTVVFGKSCGAGWKRKMWFFDENVQDLLMLQGKMILLGGRTTLQLLEATCSVRSFHPHLQGFFWMVFAKAVRLYQCENDLRAITILVTNPFVVKAIWRRPLNWSKMRWRCSKSGVRSTKLSYQYQVSREMLFFVCHFSSGPLPDISRVIFPLIGVISPITYLEGHL